MTADLRKLERDPDYWWLRFRYATREGDRIAATEAQNRLRELGIRVEVDGSPRPSEGVTA